MSLEDRMEQWERSIQLAEQHELLISPDMARDILESLVTMRTKYKNLVIGIITAVEENKSM